MSGRRTGGPPARRTSTGTELAALLYLAVAVTAVVFVAWFSAVERLGAERTGLFNGLVPIASLIAVAVIGTGTATGMQLAGALSVLAGVTFGLTQRARPPADTRRPELPAAAAAAKPAGRTARRRVAGGREGRQPQASPQRVFQLVDPVVATDAGVAGRRLGIRIPRLRVTRPGHERRPHG